MPINIQYSPSAQAIGDVAYQAGRGMATRETASQEAKMAFSQDQAALQRNHQIDAMRENAAIQQQAAEEAQTRKIDYGKEVWKQKDQFQKDQTQQRRSKYLKDREAIDNAIGSGQINQQQRDVAMQRLQERYADDDIDVTDPYFSEVTKEESPMFTTEDGRKVPMPLDNNGNPDPAKAYELDQRNQLERDRLEEQREARLQKDRGTRQSAIAKDAESQAKAEAKDRKARMKDNEEPWSAVDERKWVKDRTEYLTMLEAARSGFSANNKGQEQPIGERTVDLPPKTNAGGQSEEFTAYTPDMPMKARVGIGRILAEKASRGDQQAAKELEVIKEDFNMEAESIDAALESASASGDQAAYREAKARKMEMLELLKN